MSLSYLLRRIGLMAYTLAIVSILVFGITQILPADAAVMMLGESATPDALAGLRERLGLNDPFWLQYWHWLSAALRGDFGTSLRTGLPVAGMMTEALSRSLLLAALAIA